MEETTLVQKAREYGTACHQKVNHGYDGQDYEVHLQMVHDIAERFLHLLPEDRKEAVLAACWVHDVIEDCRETYNDVKEVLGEAVADLAYAVTNEKGKTRKERANEKYYEGIRNTPQATYVKLCDRIANATYSLTSNPHKGVMYKKENSQFRELLFAPEYAEMFEHLDEVVAQF